MPGLAGCVLDRPAAADDARQLLARLAGPGDERRALSLGQAAFAHARLPIPVQQGGVAEDERLLVVAHGWIADAAVREVAPTARPAALAEFLRDLYARDGAEALATQNGVYAVAVWDARQRTLILAHDSRGISPLHIRARSGRLCFASAARALVEPGGAQLDRAALGHVLSVGYPMGAQTLFEGVSVLPPGSIGRWREQRLSIERVWSPPAIGQEGRDASDRDAAEAVAELDHALTASVSEQLADAGSGVDVVLPLSGGLDSRVVLAYGRRHAPAIRTYSYGHSHSRDRRFGARLARVAGAKHRSVRLSERYMARLGPRLVYLTEGRASLHAAHPLCLNPEIARRQALCLSGFLGDALTGAHLSWIADEHRAGDDAGGHDPAGALFGRAYQMAFDDAGLAEVLRPEYADGAMGAAHAAFREIYDRGGSAVERADRVDMELRQHRFVNYQLDTLGQVACVRLPFADRRVLAVLERWPRAWRTGQLLYKRLLCEHHEDLARVPFTATGVPLAGPAPALAWRRRLEHLRWHTLRKVTFGLVTPHDYRQYAHYNQWIRSGAAEFFTQLFADEEVAGSVFDLERLRALLTDHLERRVDAFQRLCAAATIILWLRFFAGAQEPADPSSPGEAAEEASPDGRTVSVR